MAKHLMVVLSNAKADEVEEEFNRWYTDVHMLETINKLEGFTSAQRFQLADLPDAPPHDFKYLAVYEIDDDQLEKAYQQFTWQRQERAEALAEGREPVLSVSPTIDGDKLLVGFFSAITEKVPSGRTPAASRH